jgi:SAM-dependent methyltransferase
MIVQPKRVTWQRWLNLRKSPYSLLRSIEYEMIQGIKLQGNILDLGGGAKSSYNSIFKVEGDLFSVNIDSSMHPTVFGDLNQVLPFAAGAFDCIISLNTFEHIYHDEVTISESLRVLRPGGKFYFVIPFLFYIHASPGDYHRHTAFWWKDFLLQSGIKPESLTIEPLVWDALTSVISLYEHRRITRMFRKIFMLYAVIKQANIRKLVREPGLDGAYNSNYPLGYFIFGQKP